MFKLINYANKLKLIEETNTQYVFQCPVCGGQSLKLSKEKGAYCCFSNKCSPKSIRTKLGINGFVNEDKFEKIKTKPSKIITEPDFNFTDIKYVTVNNYKLEKSIHKNNTIKTKYIYNSNCLVERVDKSNGIKECYPKFLNNGIWTFGSSLKFGLYGDQYLKTINNPSTIIIVEGEKTANILTNNTGYLSISPPGFGWNRDYILNWYINHIDKIRNVIIIPDNDTIGYNKSDLLKYIFWELDVSAKVIFLNKYFSMDIGDDIVNLIERQINVKEILDKVEDYV